MGERRGWGGECGQTRPPGSPALPAPLSDLSLHPCTFVHCPHFWGEPPRGSLDPQRERVLQDVFDS